MSVQLDDELVASLDRVAAEEGLSRSALLRRSAEAILAIIDELPEGYTLLTVSDAWLASSAGAAKAANRSSRNVAPTETQPS